MVSAPSKSFVALCKIRLAIVLTWNVCLAIVTQTLKKLGHEVWQASKIERLAPAQNVIRSLSGSLQTIAMETKYV